MRHVTFGDGVMGFLLSFFLRTTPFLKARNLKIAREGMAMKQRNRGVLGNWSRESESGWERGHHDLLAREAAAAWRKWRNTLPADVRGELNEETRQDRELRVSNEILEERSRRSARTKQFSGAISKRKKKDRCYS